MKHFCSLAWVLVAAICHPIMLQARTVLVTSANDVNTSTWQAGDTLWMSGTNWTNQQLRLQGNGTATAPIVLRTATPGATTLDGNSNLVINGNYWVVDGLRFSGTYTGQSAIITTARLSHHNRITNSEIASYNPTNPTLDTKWVSLYGQDHLVDHCAFTNKTNSGTLLVVWLENDTEARHRIHHCRFGQRTPNVDEDGKELNGQEIIRIGDSSTSMTNACCMVDSNYFEHCDGEIETISNKSCGNTYRANTFYQCKGTLTLRHGNNCVVEYNYFIGDNISQTGGIRVIGENHIVRYNTLQDLAGTNFRAAICVVRGKPNSQLNEYYPVVNAQIYGNTIINCKHAFCLNYNSSSSCTVDATNSAIYDNQIYLDPSHSSYKIFYEAHSVGTGIELTNNTIYNTRPLVLPVVEPIATAANTGPVTGLPTHLSSQRIPACPIKYIFGGHVYIRATQCYNLQGQSTHF